MREILFRAKWMHNKEWIEGYYCKISETTYAFAEDYDKYPIPVHHYILQEKMTDWGLPNRFWQYEIDPGTLCQYTGLKNKNGKKIWENDIIRVENSIDEGTGVVVFYEGVWYVDRGVNNSLYDIALYDDEAEIYIIGNIIDNPYMVKKG
jgi:uncharacterized phage protein (TIGR01671 family)